MVIALVSVRTIGEGPLDEESVRRVYAASDASLVARARGTGTESGLVMDCARLGVPLLVSDHDPELTARLRGQSWARTFTAHDPDDLARVLDRCHHSPPSRPKPEAAAAVGLTDPHTRIAFYASLYQSLSPRQDDAEEPSS